jgi:hypothetical protein
LSSISCARTSCLDLKANRVRPNAPLVSAGRIRNVIQLFVVALERLRLRPALSLLLSPKNLNYLAPADRRRWNTIERYHS